MGRRCSGWRVYAGRREGFGIMGSLSRKMLIDRIYPALSKHEIGTSEDRELVVRWQSEIEGAAKELDRILEEQKKRDAEGPHCDACGSPVREEVPSLGMPQ